MDKEHRSANGEAWNQGPYAAWLQRFGTPREAADKIKANPAARLGTLASYMGELNGKKTANLLGSHGGKAVALALLGADVTVVDIAAENARYAEEVAREAGVPLRYVVADVLELPETERSGDYDIVLMEFGILHYFTELAPLMRVVADLLKQGGRLVLQDFHPITTKLISSKGTRHTIRKHKVDGDYFDESVHEVEVPYEKFLPGSDPAPLKKVLQRRWTLGEIVTAVAAEGLYIRTLLEEPNRSSDVFDKGIPKSFLIAADKL
ncbi:class I SAM-dependent methyltransferase [Paenibacillus sp. MBLB4367]|uniref:class I SAM-dependent methyltransferase n=1 Tax=Paenibacillus sp. MBLB4367 TaxID=3384767 RepID=UPI0039082538